MLTVFFAAVSQILMAEIDLVTVQIRTGMVIEPDLIFDIVLLGGCKGRFALDRKIKLTVIQRLQAEGSQIPDVLIHILKLDIKKTAGRADPLFHHIFPAVAVVQDQDHTQQQGSRKSHQDLQLQPERDYRNKGVLF